MSLNNRQRHKTNHLRLLDLFNPFPLVFLARGALRDGRFERVGEFGSTYSVELEHVFGGAADCYLCSPKTKKKGDNKRRG